MHFLMENVLNVSMAVFSAHNSIHKPAWNVMQDFFYRTKSASTVCLIASNVEASKIVLSAN